MPEKSNILVMTGKHVSVSCIYKIGIKTHLSFNS